MSIGIKAIGVYIPEHRVSNYNKMNLHGTNALFIEKIGITSVARKADEMKASDLCSLAFQDLLNQDEITEVDNLDFMCVCTQNGDYRLPHTSAIVQQKLSLPVECASFDISLGCSGYVYSILIAKSFMEMHNCVKGLVFTADPYSNIIDKNDKATDLLFGDAATVTLLTADPVMAFGNGTFCTMGRLHDSLIAEEGKHLTMTGRQVYNFVMQEVPANLNACLARNCLDINDVDIFLFHQANKYILTSLIGLIGLDPAKTPFSAGDYGNTVSSSIPILLKDFLHQYSINTLLISGFGVGLSISSCILRRA